ncbi:MAG: hypothetical protein J1F66_01840 [Clostridiales bacterium]|nr:hypothetical protein [Clostridiales bacterium]
MTKNRVKERSRKEEFAKFYYASQKMFFDLKASRVLLYVIALVPIVLSFIPAVSNQYVFICSIISFGLSLLNESLTSFLNEYKKKAVMEYQLYETGIAGTEFSKIEYDRETTNEVNELAIRKGLPQMRGKDAYYDVNVPEEIPDEYAYLYLCRRSAATTKFLLSRIFYIYLFFLIMVAVGFVVAVFFKSETIEYLTLLITFYPVVSPIIKACGKCKECMRDCTKLCADIDNYFADGDVSLERLARMHYYVQYIEFEMLTNRPTIYTVFKKMFSRGVADLEEGVTIRFERAIVELKGKSMMQKGIISSPKGRTLITKVDYDLDKLNKLEKGSKQKSKKAKTDTPAKTEPAKTAPSKATATKSDNKPEPATKSQSATKPQSTTKTQQSRKTAKKSSTAKKTTKK